MRPPGFPPALILGACVVVALGGIAACVDETASGNPGTATATPAAPTQEASPTPKVTLVPEPTRDGPRFQFYPPGTLSGAPAVDALLDAHYRRDVEAIYSLMNFQPVPCAPLIGLDRKIPRCRADEPAGTPVLTIRAFGCPEGGVARADEVRGYLHFPPLLHVVYRVAGTPPPGLPADARYVVALGEPDAGVLWAYVLKESGRVSEIQFHCAFPGLDLGPGVEPILPAIGVPPQ